MEMNDLNKDFMEKALEDAAWKELSSYFAWNETSMIKYMDKINWNQLSSNRNVLWCVSILEKFKSKLDWNKLSDINVDDFFSESLIEKFEKYWNWKVLSHNCAIELTFELIDRFVDRWDWTGLIDNSSIEQLNSDEFLTKYSRYIPASEIESSSLWFNLVELKKKKLTREILSTI